MEKGYVHVYTGNGKGKTTAAFGLAVRALCAGKKVYIGQFVKDMKYSETRLTEKFESLTIEQLGKGCFIYNEPEEKDIKAAKRGLKKVENILQKDEYQVVILGRYAEEKLINYADLVTEMKEIKHYYKEHGVLSREGIDR